MNSKISVTAGIIIGHCLDGYRSLSKFEFTGNAQKSVTDSDRSVTTEFAYCHLRNAVLTCTNTKTVTDSDRYSRFHVLQQKAYFSGTLLLHALICPNRKYRSLLQRLVQSS